MPRLPTKKWRKEAYAKALYAKLGELEAEKRFYRKNPHLFVLEWFRKQDLATVSKFTATLGLTVLVHQTIQASTELMEKAKKYITARPHHLLMGLFGIPGTAILLSQISKEEIEEAIKQPSGLMLWLLSFVIAWFIINHAGQIFQTTGNIAQSLPALVGKFLG